MLVLLLILFPPVEVSSHLLAMDLRAESAQVILAT